MKLPLGEALHQYLSAYLNPPPAGKHLSTHLTLRNVFKSIDFVFLIHYPAKRSWLFLCSKHFMKQDYLPLAFKPAHNQVAGLVYKVRYCMPSQGLQPQHASFLCSNSPCGCCSEGPKALLGHVVHPTMPWVLHCTVAVTTLWLAMQ